MNLDNKANILENALDYIQNAINELKSDNEYYNYVDMLREVKSQIQEEFENVVEQQNEIWLRDRVEQNREFERSKVQ